MIWNWLIFQIPWQVQVGILLIIALVALYFIGRIFGWGVAKQIALPVLGILGAIGLLSRTGQQGYGSRKAEEQVAEKKAEQVVERERDTAKSLPDDKLNKEVDEWTRNS